MTFCFCQSHANTKPDSLKLNLVVKTDIVVPLVTAIQSAANANVYAFYSLTIEKFIKKKHTVQLTFMQNWSTNFFSNNNGTNYRFNAWSFAPQYKFFFFKRKPQTGLYMGAYARYLYDNEVNYTNRPQDYLYTTTSSFKQNSIGAGITAGVQFYLLKRRLVMDIMLGLGFLKPISHTQFFATDGQAAIKAQLQAINIGYKF